MFVGFSFRIEAALACALSSLSSWAARRRKRLLRTRTRARSRPKARRKGRQAGQERRRDGAASGEAGCGYHPRGCAAHRQGGGGGGGAAEPLKLEEDDNGGATRAAPTWRARCRSTPTMATARWPSSTPATLSSCGSEAARSSAGRTSQRRRLSTSRRSRGCLRATAAACASSPSRTRGSSPTIPTRRRSTSRYSPRCSSGLSRGRHG